MRTWRTALGLVIGLAMLACAWAQPAARPFVIAPVVEGLLDCGAPQPGTHGIAANSYCEQNQRGAARALGALLNDLEPGGARGSVQVGYVLTVQLLGLYRARGADWVIDDAAVDRVLALVREVDRPVVVYLAANHFDTSGPLPDELLRDYARLQAEAQGLRDQLKAILAQSLGGRP